MRSDTVKITVLLIMLAFFGEARAQQNHFRADSISMNNIKDKDQKKLDRLEERSILRQSHRRFSIKIAYVYAFLDTEISFDLRNRNLNSTLSFEQNLGLPSNSFFFTGSFLYRITPRSGIYAQYYGINRNESSLTDKDYVFKNDTILSGTNITVSFNTQVISAGYLYSVLREPNAFLGFYFNMYFMFIESGVRSDLENINSNVELIAPLPNVGLIASFRITKWLNLNGGIGFFSLHTSSFKGSLYNFDISLMAKPTHWLGINLSYQEFDVRVEFPSDEINTIVDYNFRGPSIGLSFIF